MAEKSTTHDDAVSPEAVADSMGGAYWSVDDCVWPDLDEDLVDLLAPPIVVCTSPVSSRTGPPAAPAHRRPRGIGARPNRRR
jgi:hypothetical protein